jgi:hypothetical protein
MGLLSFVAKNTIKPRGKAEEAIFAHIWEQTPVESVLQALLDSEVLLFSQNPAGAVPGGDPKPLVTEGRDGQPAMLVFTSRERSSTIARQMPDPSAAPLAMPFREVLRWAPAELGLIVNMGTALTAEATAAQMAAVRKQAGIFRPS